MKILFVDNKQAQFDRFLLLPFAQEHRNEIEYEPSPVGLTQVVEKNSELRLIILDLLWESDVASDALDLGARALRELAEKHGDVRVVIYTILDDRPMLQRLLPELYGLGIFDWITKDEPLDVRSYKFQRAYDAGRDKAKRPLSETLLPLGHRQRSDVHAAVMFIDMSGFSTLAHEIRLTEVVTILREFYSLVGDTVRGNRGYVDKYIGDAVMAVFGATGTHPAPAGGSAYPHVQDCIYTAKQIQARANTFHLERVMPVLRHANKRLPADQMERIGKFRIGIESGIVEIVRFERGDESEITIIGVPVNLAARIIAEAEPGEVWMGENAQSTGALSNEVGPSQPAKYKNNPGDFLKYPLRF